MLTEGRFVGRRIPPRSGLEKASGRYLYPSDISLDGMLHARILKSPHPHARITRIDASEAEALPGVSCVLTHQNVPSGAFGATRDRRVLDSVVRFVGDYVAAVAAVDAERAAEALEHMRVDYAPLPYVFDPEEAVKPGAPQLYPSGNVMVASSTGATVHILRGDVEAGFAEADQVYERTYHQHASHGMALEPRCCVAIWADPQLTLYDTNQSPYHVRDSLSPVLGLPKSNIRVVCQATGGGYGSKARAQPYHFIASLLSMKTGRPVKLSFTREDETIAGHINPEVKVHLKIGITRHGQLTAIQERSLCNVGGWNQLGDKFAKLQARVAATLYRKCPHVRCDAYAVYTNSPAAGPYRGYAERVSGFALECLLDEAAEDLHLDPLEIRRKNWVTPGDDLSPVYPDIKISSVGLEECLTACTKLVVPRTEDSGSGNPAPWRRQGTGWGLGVKMLGPRLSPSSAEIELQSDGSFLLRIGTPDIGTEQQTAQAQIAAEVLGVEMDRIQIRYADTADDVPDFGIFSDRSTAAIGRCVVEVSARLLIQLQEAAADLMGEPADQLRVRDGKISSTTSPDKFVTFKQVADALAGTGRKAAARFFTDASSEGVHGFAAAAVQLTVDTLTGHVTIDRCVAAQDVGKAINPLLIEGQIEGSTAQAIGLGLSEQLVFDPGRVSGMHHPGRALNPGYLDFHLPTVFEVGEVVPLIVETFEPLGPYGAKGAGQAAMGAVLSALVNALSRAVGTRFYELPVTRKMILDALRKAEGDAP